MRKTDSVLYVDLAPLEFKERLSACPVAYLPLGTLEYHGPHLPLGTDILLSDSLFRLAAKQTGGIVMPGLFVGPDRHVREDGVDYYGMDVYLEAARSPEYYPLQQFPGSAYWVSDDFYRELLKSILSQLARAGFRVVVGCGHGPSTSGFMALEDWAKETLGLTLLTPYRCPVRFVHDHAGKSETSIIMHFRPELVHMDRLPADLSVFTPGMGGEDPRTTASAEYTAGMLPDVLEYLDRCIREALAGS